MTAVEMDIVYEWVTPHALPSTAPLARTLVLLPHVPGAKKSDRRHSGVGANTFPAEKQVLPRKERIRVFPCSTSWGGEGVGEEGESEMRLHARNK